MEIEDNPLHDLTAEQVRGLLGTIYSVESDFPEPTIPEGY